MRNRWWFAGSVGGAIGSLIGYALASPRAQLIGRTMWHGPRSRREIALTFDNGPSPEGTGQILDLLAREDVRATFFMLGASVEKHPDLARAVVGAPRGQPRLHAPQPDVGAQPGDREPARPRIPSHRIDVWRRAEALPTRFRRQELLHARPPAQARLAHGPLDKLRRRLAAEQRA